MKEIAEYFERLLWFVYRVLFTLLPGVFFIFIAITFLSNFKCFNIETIIKTSSSLGFAKWVILFAGVFCCNLIFESLTNLLVFRVLNFRKLSQDQYNKDKALINLLTTFNPKILELLTVNHKKITLEPALFNFGLTQGNQKSIWFNNYVWFLISREFLFSNLSISLLISSILFLPFYLFKCYGADISIFVRMEIIQVAATIAVFCNTRILLKINYPPNEVDYDSYFSKYSWQNILMLLMPTSLFITAIVLFQHEHTVLWAIFIMANSALFLVSPLLFLRALREFVHVEYLIMTFFAKDNYENKINNYGENRTKDFQGY